MNPSPQTASPVLDAPSAKSESRAMSAAPASFKSEFLQTLQARGYIHQITHPDELDAAAAGSRSEERRVGKECALLCRSRWSPYH